MNPWMIRLMLALTWLVRLLAAQNWIKVAQAENEAKLCTAQQAAVSELSRVSNLHYVPRKGKLGADQAIAGESTGGMGVHPSSLAHLHMAEFVAAKLRPILGLPHADN